MDTSYNPSTNANANVNELMDENRRLKSTQPVGQKATLFIVAILVLAVLSATFVLAISVLRPAQDNTALIAVIIGIISPVILGLLAGAVQQVHLAVNSRLSQLLELTAASAKAQGKLTGIVAGTEQERKRIDQMGYTSIPAIPIPPIAMTTPLPVADKAVVEKLDELLGDKTKD